MRLRFTKMHGAGNDFMVIDGVRQKVDLDQAAVRALAHRQFGIGFDQLLLVEPAQDPSADFRYRIFNADGIEVEQCGNGARCFARFVYDTGLTEKRLIRVETTAGLIVPRLEADERVTVDMGPPIFDLARVPYAGTRPGLRQTIDIDGSAREICVLSMGNPHAVQFVADLDAAPISVEGPLIEHHRLFPKRVNVGYAQVVEHHTIRLRVHERGAGETLACGTGACAAAVAGIELGLLDSPVKVITRGGELSIAWQPGQHVFMTGPAVRVYDGEIDLPAGAADHTHCAELTKDHHGGQ